MKRIRIFMLVVMMVLMTSACGKDSTSLNNGNEMGSSSWTAEKLEEKDAIIQSQQEENNKLAADNAALCSRKDSLQEFEEKLKKAEEKIEQKRRRKRWSVKWKAWSRRWRL